MNSTLSQTQYEELLSNTTKFQEILDKELSLKMKVKKIVITYENPKVNNIADLLFNLFFLGAETYYSNETKHCGEWRLRSIDDCYLIAKYYNLNVSLAQVKELIEYLYNIGLYSKSSKNMILNKSFCTTVRKRVHSRVINLTLEELTQILEKNNMNYGKKEEELQVNS